MGTNYGTWLEAEDAWAEEIDKRFKKSMVKWMIGLPVACVFGLFALGWVSNGILEQGISNIKYGALAGVVVFFLCLMSYFGFTPGKSYKKFIRRMLDKEFPQDSEKEEFAAQMLGRYGKDSLCRITKNENSHKEEVIRVTKDFVLRINPSANLVQLVDLRKVEKIETDAYTTTQKVGNANVRNQNYEIVFRYRTADASVKGRKKRQEGVSMVFDKRGIRDQLLEALRTVTAE